MPRKPLAIAFLLVLLLGGGIAWPMGQKMDIFVPVDALIAEKRYSEAIDMLRGLLVSAPSRTSAIKERIAKAHLLEADDEIASQHYNEALSALSIFWFENPERADQAQKRIRKINQVREQYNKDAKALLAYMSDLKNRTDPNYNKEITRRLQSLDDLDRNNLDSKKTITSLKETSLALVNQDSMKAVMSAGRSLIDAGEYAKAAREYIKGFPLFRPEFDNAGYNQLTMEAIASEVSKAETTPDAYDAAQAGLVKAAADLVAAFESGSPDRVAAALPAARTALEELRGLRESVFATGASLAHSYEALPKEGKSPIEYQYLAYLDIFLRGRPDTFGPDKKPEGEKGKPEGMGGAMLAQTAALLESLGKAAQGAVDEAYADAEKAYDAGSYAEAGTAFSRAAALIAPGGEVLGYWVQLSPTDFIPDLADLRAKIAAASANQERLTRLSSLAASGERLAGLAADEVAVSAEAVGYAAKLSSSVQLADARSALDGYRASIRALEAKLAVEAAGKAARAADASAAAAKLGEDRPTKTLAGYEARLDKAVAAAAAAEYATAAARGVVEADYIERELAAREAAVAADDALTDGLVSTRPERARLGYLDPSPTKAAEALALEAPKVAGLVLWISGDLASMAAESPGLVADPAFAAARARIDGLAKRAAELQARSAAAIARADEKRKAAATALTAARADMDAAKGRLSDAKSLIALDKSKGAKSAAIQKDFADSQARLDSGLAGIVKASTQDFDSKSWDDFQTQYSQLVADLGQTKKDYIIDETFRLLAEGQTYYEQGLFDLAAESLNSAQDLWLQDNDGQQEQVKYWQNLVRQASDTNNKREVKQGDVLYYEIGNYLSQARKLFLQGDGLMKTGHSADATTAFDAARQNIGYVTRAFPLNAEAGLLTLQILKSTDPAAYRTSLPRRIQEAIALLATDASSGYSRLADLYKMEPTYPGLKAALENAEIKVGKRQAPPTRDELAKAASFVADAERLLGTGRKDDATKAESRPQRRAHRRSGQQAGALPPARPQDPAGQNGGPRPRGGRPGHSRSGDAILRRAAVQSGPGPAVAAAVGPGQEVARGPQARQRLEDIGVLMAPNVPFGKKAAPLPAVPLAAVLVLVFAASPSWAEYWEAPDALATGRYPSFYAAAAGPVAIWQESKESGDAGSARIRFARLEDGAWIKGDVSDSSYSFNSTGLPPILYSAAQSPGGTIAVAIAASGTSIEVRLSRDGGRSFALAGTLVSGTTSVAPRIYPSASGGWLVFATQGRPSGGATDSANAAAPNIQQGSVSVYVARSADGSTWSGFAPLVSDDEGLPMNFAPFSSPMRAATTVAATTVAKDIVVFQTFILGEGDLSSRYALMSKTSADGGATWTKARAITDFADPSGGTEAGPQYYDNEAAQLVTSEGGLYVAWERRKAKSTQTQVWAGRLDDSGLLEPKSVGPASSAALVASSSFKLSQLADIGGRPSLLALEEKLKANRVLISSSKEGSWASMDADLAGRSDSSGSGLVTFARAVQEGGRTYVAWQLDSGDTSRIFAMLPVTKAPPPALAPLNFALGKRARPESAQVRVDLPEDAAGIKAYAYLWRKTPDKPSQATAAQVRPAIAELWKSGVAKDPGDRSLSLPATQDGNWTLWASVEDNAGNRSPIAEITYYRKRIPPPAPIVISPDTDARGFLVSNTFTVRWVPPEADDLAGYTWDLSYAGPLEAGTASPASLEPGKAPTGLPGLTAYESGLLRALGNRLPPPGVMGSAESYSATNVDNGYYVFSVSAIDTTGNISGVSSILLRTDKYQPYTVVTLVDPKRDDLGRTALRLFGRGFLADGRIERVVMSRNGREPYAVDRSFDKGDYVIPSDRELSGISFDDIEAGSYRIGLFHSTRGWYWTSPLLAVDSSGTVKYGVTANYEPAFRLFPGRNRPFSIYDAMVLMAIAFAAAGILLSSRQIFAVAREGDTLRLEALALVTGGPMPQAISRRAARALKRRGVGLRVKFTLIIAFLVIIVVLMLATFLGYNMIIRTSAELATGLDQRARVLLQGVAQGGRFFLGKEDAVTQLSPFPSQAKAMQGANYITITGSGKRPEGRLRRSGLRDKRRPDRRQARSRHPQREPRGGPRAVRLQGRGRHRSPGAPRPRQGRRPARQGRVGHLRRAPAQGPPRAGEVRPQGGRRGRRAPHGDQRRARLDRPPDPRHALGPLRPGAGLDSALRRVRPLHEARDLPVLQAHPRVPAQRQHPLPRHGPARGEHGPDRRRRPFRHRRSHSPDAHHRRHRPRYRHSRRLRPVHRHSRPYPQARRADRADPRHRGQGEPRGLQDRGQVAGRAVHAGRHGQPDDRRPRQGRQGLQGAHRRQGHPEDVHPARSRPRLQGEAQHGKARREGLRDLRLLRGREGSVGRLLGLQIHQFPLPLLHKMRHLRQRACRRPSSWSRSRRW